MAISQMKRLSLILPKYELDKLLFHLQALQTVQIYDLHKEQEWQLAFEDATLSREGHSSILQELSKRQERLAKMIERLEPFLPKKKLVATLQERPLELPFHRLEQVGQTRDEEALLRKIHQQLQTLENAETQIEQMSEQIANLKKWEKLDLTPQMVQSFRHIRAIIGTIPNRENDKGKHRLQAREGIDVQEIFTNEAEQGLLIFYQAGFYDAIQQLLEDLNFKPFDYESPILPRERVSQLQEMKRKQELVLQSTRDCLAASKEELEQLKVQLDYVLNLSLRQQAKGLMASSKRLVALEGWVETEQVEELRTSLEEQFGESILLDTRMAQENDDVPTKLKNHVLVEPFELVTEMYALPKYHDKDPTPIVSLFYFVFFGMMVADLGYGLLVFLGTSLALRYFHLTPSLAKNLRFFRLLSVAVMIWGLIYGSFLGFSLPFALINTNTDAMMILMISVVFGFITVLTGLALSGIKNVRLKEYAEAYNSGFAWVFILFGLMLFAVGQLFSQFAALSMIGLGLAGINAVGILIVSIVSVRSIKGLGTGLFNLYNISSYVGDLVSFTRLMALGLSGASIGSAFNLIVNLFPPLARFSIGILLFIVLHFINLFLSFLSGYVHGARLIFVEFFGKFYDGGGTPFRPLKPIEKYVKNKVEKD